MATDKHFYYKIENLHDLANRESIYALDTVETEPQRKGLTDDSILGMDEESFYKRLLKSAAAAVYKRLHRRGRGNASGYQFDEDYEEDTGYVIFNFSFPDNFDTNLIDPLDMHIQDALLYHTLWGWFKKTRRNYLSENFLQQYNEAIDQCKSLIEMRTKVRRPGYFFAKYYDKISSE